jgi:hypothetical protein
VSQTIYKESVINVIKEIWNDLAGTGHKVTDVLFSHVVEWIVEKPRKRQSQHAAIRFCPKCVPRPSTPNKPARRETREN